MQTNQLDESSQNQEIFISSASEYDNLHNLEKFNFYCKGCGRIVTRAKLKDKKSQERQRRLLCKSCGTKQTNLERYGTEYSFQAESVKEKIVKTNIERYGHRYPMQSSEVRNRANATNLKRYGYECCTKNEQVKNKGREKWNSKTEEEKRIIREKIKNTNLKRYGSASPLSDKSVQEKSKQTCMSRYGVEHYSKTESFKNDYRDTMISKYGVEHALQSDQIKDDMKTNLLTKYGVDNVSKLESVKDKRTSTLLKNYGVENPSQSETIKHKRVKTFIERFGVENPFMAEHVKIKIKSILIEKYGVENAHFLYKKFVFNEVTFDSYWELCFYVYHIDNGLQITREPEPIRYVFNDEEHLYYPDFEVGGQLYEIKGDQFFKDDGTMQNPYDHSQDALFEAKHQCALQNKVIFIKQNEIKLYINYVESKYGKGFKEEHKV